MGLIYARYKYAKTQGRKNSPKSKTNIFELSDLGTIIDFIDDISNKLIDKYRNYMNRILYDIQILN